MKSTSSPEAAALRARLRDLEAEASGVVRRLRETADAELPGAHLVLTAGTKQVLLAAASVEEVVATVALQPVVGMAAAVAGAFTYRGRSLLALELGAVLERRAARPPLLDAHLVVLNTASPLALMVDRVLSVVNGVTLVAEERAARGAAVPAEGDRRAPSLGQLVARVGVQVMPLVDPAQLGAWVEGRAS